jgi:hypothetical protein
VGIALEFAKNNSIWFLCVSLYGFFGLEVVVNIELLVLTVCIKDS